MRNAFIRLHSKCGKRPEQITGFDIIKGENELWNLTWDVGEEAIDGGSFTSKKKALEAVDEIEIQIVDLEGFISNE